MPEHNTAGEIGERWVRVRGHDRRVPVVPVGAVVMFPATNSKNRVWQAVQAFGMGLQRAITDKPFGQPETVHAAICVRHRENGEPLFAAVTENNGKMRYQVNSYTEILESDKHIGNRGLQIFLPKKEQTRDDIANEANNQDKHENLKWSIRKALLVFASKAQKHEGEHKPPKGASESTICTGFVLRVLKTVGCDLGYSQSVLSPQALEHALYESDQFELHQYRPEPHELLNKMVAMMKEIAPEKSGLIDEIKKDIDRFAELSGDEVSNFEMACEFINRVNQQPRHFSEDQRAKLLKGARKHMIYSRDVNAYLNDPKYQERHTRVDKAEVKQYRDEARQAARDAREERIRTETAAKPGDQQRARRRDEAARWKTRTRGGQKPASNDELRQAMNRVKGNQEREDQSSLLGQQARRGRRTN